MTFAPDKTLQQVAGAILIATLADPMAGLGLLALLGLSIEQQFPGSLTGGKIHAGRKP